MYTGIFFPLFYLIFGFNLLFLITGLKKMYLDTLSLKTELIKSNNFHVFQKQAKLNPIVGKRLANIGQRYSEKKHSFFCR